jgi:uncharacterized membrane protein
MKDKSHLSSTHDLCQVCKKSFEKNNLYPVELVRPTLLKFIKSEVPDIARSGYICLPELNQYKAAYVEYIMKLEKKETKVLEKDVVKSLRENELLAKNINADFDKGLTYGDRLSDRIASFGGSWKFIIFFMSVLFIWIVINTIALLSKPFDPFPYILLNLILSCIAAIQAPVIMMSQNRQEAKDRLRAEHDYKINLKAELEIRHLNEKMDHLLMNQWQRLLEIQQLQTEIMEEILGKKGKA